MDRNNRTHSRKKAGRVFKWVGIIVLILIVLGYFGVGFYAADKLTLPIRRFDPDNKPVDYGVGYEEVNFPSRDGEATLEAWFLPNESSSQVVLMVHGNNCSRTWEIGEEFPRLAAGLQKAGFNVLMFDLRGHGESSDGRRSFGIYERYDVLGAIDWLLAQGFKTGSIGVFGVSAGSASSIGALLEAPDVGALVIESTFADIYPIIKTEWQTASGLPSLFLPPTRLMIWLRYGYDLASARPVEEIGEIEQPILMIQCTTDQTIPFEQAQQLVEAAQDPETWFLDGCIHARAYQNGRAEYEQRVADFFNQTLE
jgi:pimeloyl-ACP methyl ester carboxylesterase